MVTQPVLPGGWGQLTPYMASLRSRMKSELVKNAHRPSVQHSSDRMCCSTRWKSPGARITNVRECVSSPMGAAGSEREDHLYCIPPNTQNTSERSSPLAFEEAPQALGGGPRSEKQRLLIRLPPREEDGVLEVSVNNSHNLGENQLNRVGEKSLELIARRA